MTKTSNMPGALAETCAGRNDLVVAMFHVKRINKVPSNQLLTKTKPSKQRVQHVLDTGPPAQSIKGSPRQAKLLGDPDEVAAWHVAKRRAGEVQFVCLTPVEGKLTFYRQQGFRFANNALGQLAQAQARNCRNSQGVGRPGTPP